MAEQEVLEEPIKKKWILKVSIHCEGCKRKVKKILQQVQGVSDIDIDTKQQKVTVIGNVDVDALLRKLTKAGKHAELWPVKVEEKEKMQAKHKKKEKITEQESNENNSKTAENEKEAAEPSTAKPEQIQEPSKSSQGGGANISKSVVAGAGAANKAQEPPKNNQGAAVSSGGESGGAANTGAESGGAAKHSGESSTAAKVIEGTSKTCSGDQVVKESKSEGKKPESGATVAQPSPAAEKKVGENDTANSAGKGKGNDGGNSGKKKKKKGQNGNNAGGEQSSASPAVTGSQNHEAGPPTVSLPANHIPPRHTGYHDYPPHYYGPPPVYSVNYNTAHPTSYTASYYAAPPPNSYAHSYNGYPVPESEPPPPPSDLDSYPRQPLDSFEIFSDENPNGCSLM